MEIYASMTCYSLIFKGQRLPNTNLETAKTRLAFVYQTEPETLTYLFSGEAYVLAELEDENLANQYINNFEKLGLIVEKYAPDDLHDEILSTDSVLLFDPSELSSSELLTTDIQTTDIQTTDIHDNTQDLVIDNDLPTEPDPTLIVDEDTIIDAQALTDTDNPDTLTSEPPVAFHLYFKGEYQLAANEEEARIQLQRFLVIDDVTLDQYFNGEVHCIFSSDNEGKVTLYQNYLEEKGLITYLTPPDHNHENLPQEVKVESEQEEIIHKAASDYPSDTHDHITTLSEPASELFNFNILQPMIYQVIFKGQTIVNQDTQQVAEKMAVLCQTTTTQALLYFNQQQHILKETENLQEAETLIQYCRQIGMDTELKIKTPPAL